jgi:hypothetical protein
MPQIDVIPVKFVLLRRKVRLGIQTLDTLQRTADNLHFNFYEYCNMGFTNVCQVPLSLLLMQANCDDKMAAGVQVNMSTVLFLEL